MIEAANCYAAGRWTASVFHSMRVAEYGLRRLAKRLKIKISSKGKNCPLEYGDWNDVITAIRNKITEIRKLPRGPRRENEIKFYSSTADHCEYIRDIYRNEVSHTRRRYSKPESLSVLQRVRELVQPLAKPDAEKVIKKRVKEAIKQTETSKNTSLQNLTNLQNLITLATPPKGNDKPSSEQ